jgi:uncharacterized protein (TIGR00369 family)
MSVSKAIGRHVPFAELLGIRVTHREPGLARLELDLQPDLLNSWKVAHGGVVMALADMALGLAAISTDPAARGAMTVELKVSFLGPGQGRLAAEGRCLKSGSSLAFCEGEIRDEAGALVAKALGTFTLRRERAAPPAGGPAGPDR